MLVGRDEESKRLRHVLDEALPGRARIVALRGDPGVGKTLLLEYAVEAAEGFRVIRVQGHEAEREIPFAALSMLVGPLLDSLPQLSTVQAAALEGALNVGPAVHGDRLAVAAATLAILAAAAERQPLLLAIDDVHLLDLPSLEALFFALRRLEAEPVAVILTARPEPEVPTAVEQWLERVPNILVEGLDLAAARTLTAHLGPLSAATWAAAGGNPLALLEIVPGDGAALHGEQPLRLGARLLRAYERRLTGLEQRTRDALLLLAAAGRAGDMLDQALALRGLRRTDLDRAEDEGLIVQQHGAVSFTHPLVCSAVYYSATASARRAAHRTLCAAYEGRTAPGAAERRAFHLAAGTAGPDEEVAAQLALAARTAAGRNGHTTAAALFEKAALLSPPGTARTRRIIDAAIAAQAAGTVAAAGPLLGLAIAETEDPGLLLTAEHLQCRIAMWSGSPGIARDQLLDLAARIEHTQPSRSAAMRSQAAVASIVLGDQRIAVETARLAAEQVRGLPERTVLPVLLVEALTLAIDGATAEARELLPRCEPALERADPLSIDQLELLTALAHASLEETGTARKLLEQAVRRAQAAQAIGLLPFQLSWLALICWWEGDWPSALASGLTAVQIAEETGWATMLPTAFVVLAAVEASLGKEEECREHAGLAARIAKEQSGSRFGEAQAACVLGLLELGAGRAEQAAEHLGVAQDFALAHGFGDPELFNWASDRTEALVRSGKLDAARQSLEIVEREAALTRRPSQLARVARCRGLLASGTAADAEGRAAFEEALRWHEQACQPFEQARTQLCFGEFLRRHQHRVAARRELGHALATFTRLGAAQWAGRAEAELRATGITARRRVPQAAERLTPQELQVALVVADGVTNSEAANQLFLSAKTVEFHLSNIYRKLGIRSRVELTRRVVAGLLDLEGPNGETLTRAPSPEPIGRMPTAPDE